MMQMPRILKENSGFTLLEGIAVMIVIGIISAVAAISMMQTSSSLAGYTALLKTHLRYAQTLAMNSDTGNIWGIRFNLGANQYWLFQCADPLNCDSRTPGTAVAFDNNGIPQLGISAFSPQTANVTITLDDSDTGETKTVTITQQTGFIP
jgi:prepilin-type N-terminal cleavage/methylation domain-containing protein